MSGKLFTGQLFMGAGAIFRHELRLLLFAPLSNLFQLGFLVSLSACIFLIADFYATDEASVRPMLTFLPWVALIMVPALAMRSWVDEHSDRGVELMLTLPVRLGAIVVGKFLAGYVVLLITLAFTLPLAATVYYLGDPDPGVMVAGYLASALLLAVYYAVSLFAAALAREQVGAFVISLALLFVLLLLGWDVFGRLLHGQVPPETVEALALYSPNTWLVRLARGLIDFPGVFYAVCVTTLALAGTGVIIRSRYRGSAAGAAKVWAKVLLGVGLLGLLIPLSTRVPGGLDLTAESEFTLHGGTLDVLGKLPAGTEITLYWSKHEPSVPAQIKSHARRAIDILDTLAARSGGRLTVRTIDPLPDTDEELKAQGFGIKRIPMSSGDTFFLGMTFQHGKRSGNIPYLDIRRDRLLEYDVALALNGLTRIRTPKIGVISPLLPPAAATGNREGMSFMAELRRAYDLAVIPHFKDKLPGGLDVLVLIDTTILRREMLYAIDQFVMNGGGLVVMMDPYLRFNRASNAVNPSPSDDINDISDILQKYGVKYLGEAVVGDGELASVVAEQQQGRMRFPFWMRVSKKGLSESHPATADLNEVFMVEPGALEIIDNARATALIATTGNSGILARKNFTGKAPRELAQAFKPDGQRRVIAAALKGPFDSAFSSPPEGIGASGQLKRSTGPGAPVFVIADVDWLFDPFSLQQSNVGGQVVVRPLNDNLAFLLNIIEYASGDAALIAIRSRGKLQRPFTRVADLFQAAEQKFRERETALVRRVAEIEGRIARYSETAGSVKKGHLPDQIKADLKKFRMELLPARRELRALRRQIRNEVDNLGRRLTLINLVAGPALVGIWGMGVAGWRRRRRRAN
ncbi:MAG: Gldg family protein [Proteobacteria bacterium]|nr:Gldg family protein [Pseudomonadota bacterium]MDA1022785.1 Gldg family protein [Pseudomonadota bacterium]